MWTRISGGRGFLSVIRSPNSDLSGCLSIYNPNKTLINGWANATAKTSPSQRVCKNSLGSKGNPAPELPDHINLQALIKLQSFTFMWSGRLSLYGQPCGLHILLVSFAGEPKKCFAVSLPRPFISIIPVVYGKSRQIRVLEKPFFTLLCAGYSGSFIKNSPYFRDNILVKITA